MCVVKKIEQIKNFWIVNFTKKQRMENYSVLKSLYKLIYDIKRVEEKLG